MFQDLPTELVRYLANILPTESATALTLCSRHFYRVLGFHYIDVVVDTGQRAEPTYGFLSIDGSRSAKAYSVRNAHRTLRPLRSSTKSTWFSISNRCCSEEVLRCLAQCRKIRGI